jgi:predicted dehydrogenase
MSISVGIVGVGMFGPAFIQPFRDHPDVHRLALCDLNADRLADRAKRFEISETYASLDEICKTDIDALAIITQPWLHVRQCVQAMEAGKFGKQTKIAQNQRMGSCPILRAWPPSSSVCPQGW